MLEETRELRRRRRIPCDCSESEIPELAGLRIENLHRAGEEPCALVL